MIRFEPVQRPSSLTDLAYTRLRAAILDGDLAPGEALSVVALSELLDMSRSPVRAAVERLTAEGLFSLSGGSPVVREVSKADLLDALQIRAPLEGLAAELAAPRLTEEQTTELAELNERFAAAVSQGDSKAARKADLEFHQRVQAECGNAMLVEHLDRVQSFLVLAAYSAAWEHTWDQAVPEHAAIIDALRARDPRAACLAASAHVSRARERAQREFAR
ncbi:GntR family transcriptional regulator [Streptomyces sp. NPDC002519]